jgi:glycosyltransferase EpsF
MSLYRSLDKSMMQFDFIVDTLDTLPEFDEIRAAGGRVFQMGRYLDNPVKYQISIEKLLKTHGQEYIALHCHSIIRALPVLLSAKRFGIAKRIIHSHTDRLDRSKYTLALPLISKVTALVATDYWACSNAAGAFFFGKKQYRIINNTIKTKQFIFDENNRVRIRKQLNIGDNQLVIGHTGRFTYQKNHDFLIEVFSELHRIQPESKLLLIGDGPLKLDIQKTVATLGLTKAVIFAGAQSDITSYLSAMDVFFLPSHYEGFCISLLEAQANGLPCLASDVVPNEVQLTSSVTTCKLKSTTTQYAHKLLELRNIGRTESAKNILTIQQSGYDTDMQLSKLLDMYSI